MSEDTKVDLKGIYDDDYFINRMSNDPKRMSSFQLEKIFIYNYISSGRLIDFGCSTGEFIQSLKWNGETYGIEISDSAAKIAKSNSIKFDHDLSDVVDYYDVIIFRGTIQHLDDPFKYLKLAYRSLKPGGYVFFLATPNTESIYYRLWRTLPMLDPVMNFWIPGSQELNNIMKNFGFTHIESRFPYLHSPYKFFFMDHFLFLIKLFSRRKSIKFPFWGSVMEICFKK